MLSHPIVGVKKFSLPINIILTQSIHVLMHYKGINTTSNKKVFLIPCTIQRSRRRKRNTHIDIAGEQELSAKKSKYEDVEKLVEQPFTVEL